MEKFFLITILCANFLSSSLKSMDMKSTHDLFSQKAQEASSAPTPFDFESKIKEVIKDKFYIGKVRGNDLYAVMERVTDENHKDWQKYATTQSNARVVDAIRLSMKNFSGGGSNHFCKVLTDISYIDYEIWVAYLTSTKNPTYSPDKFASYGNKDITAFSDKKPTEEALNALKIKMFLTVTSDQNALITTHMGISKTAESVMNNDTYKDISMDLHSFAAKVMLLRNHKRILMITTPLLTMEKIIAKNLPQNKVFVGTKEMTAEINKRKEMTFEKFKEEIYDKFTEDDLEFGDDPQTIFHEYKVPFHAYDGDQEGFNKLLIDYPPIISVDTIKTARTFMTIYNPININTPLFTITKKSSSYNWLFHEVFQPTPDTHYVAVDLPALAECRHLEPIDK